MSNTVFLSFTFVRTKHEHIYKWFEGHSRRYQKEKFFIMNLKKDAFIVKDLVDGILVPSIKTIVKTVMQHTTQILFSIVIA